MKISKIKETGMELGRSTVSVLYLSGQIYSTLIKEAVILVFKKVFSGRV
jgi:hypothetical protein